MCQRLDILVTKRTDDYMAELSHDPRFWEAGKTQVEALGKLVVNLGADRQIVLRMAKD